MPRFSIHAREATPVHGQFLEKGTFNMGERCGEWIENGGTSMVQRVYSHLGKVRHRSDVVEYRVENHREALGERLTALETLTT